MGLLNIEVVIKPITARLKVVNTQPKPAKNEKPTMPAGTRNQRPGRPSPFIAAKERNSSTESAATEPTATAKIQWGAKNVTSTTSGTATAAVMTRFIC